MEKFQYIIHRNDKITLFLVMTT